MNRTALPVILLFSAAIGWGQCVGIVVNPGDNLKTLVASNPPGTTFCLQPGIHRDFDVLNTNPVKNGDRFIGLPGAIESGAIALTGWTQVTINGTTYWTTTGGTPVIDAYNPLNCSNSKHVTLTCYYSQALYVDNSTYEHTYRLSDVVPGKWYYEFNGLQSATVIAGGSGYSVNDVLTVGGGTGCPTLTSGCGTVTVTSISGSGAVTGVRLRTLGYGYPAGPVTETTSDTTTTTTASGCTVSITGGTGGATVVNNIYLAPSENPSSHNVELNENAGLKNGCGNGCSPQWLFHSTTAQNITVQGLTIEKYAGPIAMAPVSCNHVGSNSTAAGWIIQDNELRLNMHMGINVSYGSPNVPIFVLNNVIHDNGMEGIGGGSPVSLITASGNQIYVNDTAWVPEFYGCGSIKFGGASVGNGGLLVSYNNIHDEINGCDGLWSDVYMGNVTWDHNIVTNISGDGIRIEISGTGPGIAVTNNTVTGGGNVYLRGQIDVVSSSNVTVQHNNVSSSGATPAIRVNFDGRTCGPGCTSPPANNNVSFNSVTVLSGANGVASRANYTTGNGNWLAPGIFNQNTYCVPQLPWLSASWLFGAGSSPFLSFSSWQTDGQDATGVVTAGTCPNAVQGAVTLTPAALSFGLQQANTTSATQVATLTNSTASGISVSNIGVSGDFLETNSCGPTLASGASCSISIAFAPTTAGMRSGVLTVGNLSTWFSGTGTNQIQTTASIASSLNPSAYGEPVTFKGTITGGPPEAGSAITFSDGATPLGIVVLSAGENVATFSASRLSAGRHSITASYSGDANHVGSISTPLIQTVEARRRPPR